MYKPNWIDVDKDKMHSKAFFEAMVLAFPPLEKAMEDYNENETHANMEEFSRFVNVLIQANADQSIAACFNFVNAHLPLVDSDLENALNVSFCETLITENPAEVIAEKAELMPANLRAFFEEYKEYYDGIR